MKTSFGNLKTKEQEIGKTVLFVCVHNAGRSQMAEGFFRKYAPKGYATLSAGTKPVPEINPLAIQVMKDAGIDISNQRSKDLTEDMLRNATTVVNMGCMDNNFCPTVYIPRVIDWGLDDPKDKSIEKVREIRDEIERRVKQLAAELNKQDIKKSN
jgi:arsenate reductase (thioredoxin)